MSTWPAGGPPQTPDRSRPERLLARPSREEVRAEDREAYDLVADRQQRLWAGAPSNSDLYFGALLNSPQMASTLASLGRFMRMGEVRGAYSDADRELVDMVLSVDFGYNAILALHLPDAIAVGVRLEAIEALWHGRDGELTGEERQLVHYIRQVESGTVSDASFAAIIARLGRRTTVEYTAFITFLISTLRLWQALGVPEPSDIEIEELLASYRKGEGPVVDPGARIG
jgi:hypothetical protein